MRLWPEETLINLYARWPLLFVTDCVNAPRRSYGYAFGAFSCQSQKALGHRTNSFNQRLLGNSGLHPSDSFATTTHFISWNYANAHDVLLNPCTLMFFQIQNIILTQIDFLIFQ